MSVTLSLDVLKKYKLNNDIFIETGTHRGGAVEIAIQCGFSKIYSIDISTTYKDRNYNLFKSQIESDIIKLLYGDSVDVLPTILEEIGDNTAVFWLDAHYDVFSDTRGKYGDSPIFYELDCIKKSKTNKHTILVDDIRIFRNSSEWASDKTLEQLQNKVMEVNSNYKIVFENSSGYTPLKVDDILVAYL